MECSPWSLSQVVRLADGKIVVEMLLSLTGRVLRVLWRGSAVPRQTCHELRIKGWAEHLRAG